MLPAKRTAQNDGSEGWEDCLPEADKTCGINLHNGHTINQTQTSEGKKSALTVV